MIGRRDLMIGLSCMVAAGSATALRPRHRTNLLGNARLEKLIPAEFSGWRERPTDAIVVPQDDSLAAKLYSQTVGRLYSRGDDSVMVLIAYGDTQNDLLQLHRPEVCYPAFGFRVSNSRAVPIPIGNGLILPGRALQANLRDREEQILYWTRLGEFLPGSGSEQRLAKLKNQLAGIVPDGVLVRISNSISDPERALAVNQLFARALVEVLPRRSRPALIGTRLAAQLDRGAGETPPSSKG